MFSEKKKQINEFVIKKIVRKTLEEILDRDFYNGFCYGNIIAENIYSGEQKQLISEGKLNTEKEAKHNTKRKINLLIKKIDEGKVDEVLPALAAAGTDILWNIGAEAANGIGKGQGSFGKNLQKYYGDRHANRQNYIQYGKIVDYDENGNPVYENPKTGKFWRGVKSGLATAAPWVGSAVGAVAGGATSFGLGGAAGSMAGYELGNRLGKNFNGSTQIMSKDLRNKMQADAKAFKQAKKNGQQYTSPYIAKGIKNPYIDEYEYNELNGIDNGYYNQTNSDGQYPWSNQKIASQMPSTKSNSKWNYEWS